MDKITYLAELAEGLARWVPERERQDILRYYAEYFEEAGPEREAEVVVELGDPWALSCRLAVEGGYVTYEKAVSWAPRKKWTRVLLGTAVGLSVFALVFSFGLLAVNVVRSASGLIWTDPVSIPVDDPEWSGVFELTPGDAVTIRDSGYTAFIAGNTVFLDFSLIEDRGAEVFSSIDVDVGLGNIQVVAGDGYTLSIKRSEAMSDYAPTWGVRDGVLRIRDNGSQVTNVFAWDDLKKLFSADQLIVDVIITVPEWAVLDGISVNVGLGDVLLHGVNAKIVTAETGLGNVECYNALGVRWMEMNTGKGDVDLTLDEALDGLTVRLESGMGNVMATLCGAEKDYSYELESGLSLVTVNGAVRGSSAERKGNAPYRLNAESGTGSIDVYFTFD